MMKTSSSTVCCCCLLFLQAAITSCMACTSVVFSNKLNYSSCNSLPHLGATLHWTYHPSNATVDIAYRAKPQDPSGWVGWGLNPSRSGMVGGQVLLAFPASSSGSITVYTTPMDSYDPTIDNSTLSFPVYSRAAEYDGSGGGYMTIYAQLQLPKNATKLNHVWQAGTVSGGVPDTHPTHGDNEQAKGSIDFLSGQSTADEDDSARKNIHGLLNAVSWGILMPMGVITARYLKVFKSADPAWFYLHIGCQLSAYVLGLAGWITGLQLGGDDDSSTHRNIGITLFCLATLQVFALLLRPNKDHKLRLYWNVYHHSVGYTVVVLSVINIFKGLDLLEPENKWEIAYTAVIVLLGAIAVVLEVVTWVIVIKRRRRSRKNSAGMSQNGGGANGRQNLGL